MRDEDASLVLQQAGGSDDLLKQMLAHVSIHGRERIIKEVDVTLIWSFSKESQSQIITIVVDSPGKADSLLLTTRKVDSLFSDLGPVAVGKDLQIWS